MRAFSHAFALSAVLICYAVTAQPVATQPATARASTQPAALSDEQLVKSGILRISQRQRLRITHATVATLSEGSGARVYHAMPVSRPWSIATIEHGLDKLSAEPSTPQVKLDEKTQANYFIWEIDSPTQPGPTKFVTSFEVISAGREFMPGNAKLTWADMDAPRLDRSDPAIAPATDEMVKLVQDARKKPNPLLAVTPFVQWVQKTIAYDETVGYKYTDIAAIIQNKRGHCGHRSTAFQLLCAMAGINARTAYGFQISKREGLWDGRGDWNRHTWVELHVPGVGWVEIEPAAPIKGRSPFFIPNTYIQNGYVQSASVWFKSGNRWQSGQYDQDTIEFKLLK